MREKPGVCPAGACRRAACAGMHAGRPRCSVGAELVAKLLALGAAEPKGREDLGLRAVARLLDARRSRLAIY